jgi:hypothetical protein
VAVHEVQAWSENSEDFQDNGTRQLSRALRGASVMNSQGKAFVLQPDLRGVGETLIQYLSSSPEQPPLGGQRRDVTSFPAVQPE